LWKARRALADEHRIKCHKAIPLLMDTDLDCRSRVEASMACTNLATAERAVVPASDILFDGCARRLGFDRHEFPPWCSSRHHGFFIFTRDADQEARQ
jgi:hypothetical protein